MYVRDVIRFCRRNRFVSKILAILLVDSLLLHFLEFTQNGIKWYQKIIIDIGHSMKCNREIYFDAIMFDVFFSYLVSLNGMSLVGDV